MTCHPADWTFALCLSHDVDRVRKTYQSLYYALGDRPGYHLRSLLTSDRPYWQFEDIAALERELGVRSSFYFLDEKRLLWDRSPRDWIDPRAWKLYAGRYDLSDPAVAEVIRWLDAGGWEIGLHGSFDSYREPARLEREKDRLESVLGRPVMGGRQHYLNLDVPETWRAHRRLGLQYDASLGSPDEAGFQHGYGLRRPFDDEFAVFPLTAMEVALPLDRGFGAAWRECERLLDEAAEHSAVMTVLWHQRYFNEREFPGYRRLYRKLIATALDRGAWVGPLGEYYRTFVVGPEADLEAEPFGTVTELSPGSE